MNLSDKIESKYPTKEAKLEALIVKIKDIERASIYLEDEEKAKEEIEKLNKYLNKIHEIKRTIEIEKIVVKHLIKTLLK